MTPRHEVCDNRRVARNETLLALTSLPELELPEELVLLLLGQQQPAGGLLAFISPTAHEPCTDERRNGVSRHE